MENLKIKQIPKDDEVGRIVHDEMTDEFQKRFVLVGEDETCLPEFYAQFAESIENFEVRDSDVWVCSYPKTGTTWTQEMVWLVTNELNFEGAKVDIDERFPFLEICTLFDYEKLDKALDVKNPEFAFDSVQFLKRQESPRYIKTHLPFPLLPQEIRNGSKTPKMIYVIRNPKDTCVSYYHHCKLFQGCRANLEDFTKVFLADKAMYGSFWKHVFGYWEQRDFPNVLIIRYEDMKTNLSLVIKKVASFLSKTLTEEQLDKLQKHLSFDSMKKNEALNDEECVKRRLEKNIILEEGAVLRSGTVGKYKDELSSETINKCDAWIKKNIDGTSFGQQYDYQL